MQATFDSMLRQLIPEPRGVLVAVSGGADSMALAHLLLRSQWLPLESMHWVHIHHGLRGEDAHADAEFVRSEGARLGVSVQVVEVDTQTCAREENLSIEMAARKLRFQALRDQALERGVHRVLLAHHFEDQVETLLMKWARGAAPGALGGMRNMSSRDGLDLLRPLLGVHREALRDWLEAQGLPWREDRSNRDPAYLRNRVRHRLVPVMDEVFGPGWMDSLVRQGCIQSDDDEVLETRVADWITAQEQDQTLPVHGLRLLPAALQRRILFRWMLDRFGQRLQAAQISAIRSLLESGEGCRGIDLSDLVRVERQYDRLTCLPSPAVALRAQVLPLPGLLTLPDGRRLKTERVVGFKKSPMGTPGAEGEGWIRVDRLNAGGTLELRSWREGDRFQPPGMGGHSRKLQDLFTDAKVPRSRRSHIPLVCCGEDIVWIPGYAVSHAWLVPDEEAASVHLALLPSS